MAVKLFNTLRRKKQIFTARPDNVIRMYTCGPTVYKSQHIGNYRTFIFEDILKRVLLARGYQVRHVMNITDVGHLVSDADEGEDKIEKEARVQKRSARDIARFFEMEFKKDIKTLNILITSSSNSSTLLKFNIFNSGSLLQISIWVSNSAPDP